MKKSIFIICTLLSLNQVKADGDYHYYVDLTSVKNDKLTIKLTPPVILIMKPFLCFRLWFQELTMFTTLEDLFQILK